ncbi:MAG: DUF4065 domain-containing protein [Elusimicrobia bacterium]|nr:DUF4065 domain-containing protein [Elusimicrobiota bacterium]
METGFCPHCEKTTTVTLHKRDENVRVKKAEVVINASLYVCDACKKEFATEAQEEANVGKAYDEYRRREKLLAPAAIRSIRRRYGLSQTDFSSWLGWGEITVHRYENGALPDAAHNELLWLLANPQNAKALLERNERNLNPATARMLKTKIAELLNTTGMDLILGDIGDYLSVSEPSQFNGNRKFDIERFENLVLYVLNKTKTCYKTGLNKFLWYVDFGAFRDLELSITGSQYLRWQYGPVPDGYEILYAGMICKKLFAVDETIMHNQPCEKFHSAKPPKTAMFTREELSVVDAWISTLKNKSSGDLMELSHNEKAFSETGHCKPISYHFAKDLKLACSRKVA